MVWRTPPILLPTPVQTLDTPLYQAVFLDLSTKRRLLNLHLIHQKLLSFVYDSLMLLMERQVLFVFFSSIPDLGFQIVVFCALLLVFHLIGFFQADAVC